MPTTITNRTFGRGELAQLYNPHLSPSAARKKLAMWIAYHPTLSKELEKAGLQPNQRTFTPKQVGIIFEALGEP